MEFTSKTSNLLPRIVPGFAVSGRRAVPVRAMPGDGRSGGQVTSMPPPSRSAQTTFPHLPRDLACECHAVHAERRRRRIEEPRELARVQRVHGPFGGREWCDGC
jgi:hypothetical protein